MSWLSKGIKGVSNAAKKVTRNPLNTVLAPVTGGIEALTGISAAKQLATGAAIGGGIGLAGMAAGGAGAAGAAAPAAGAGTAAASAAGAVKGIGMAGILPSVIGAGAGIYGASQQAQAQEDANAANLGIAREQMSFSAAQAQQQMDFQERMSNTQYQRGTADMKAAGINPMLAYMNGGASSPSGATGSSAGAKMEAVPSVIANGLNSAMDVLKTTQSLRESNSSIAANYASAGLSKQKMRSERFEGDLADTAGKIFREIKSFWGSTGLSSAYQKFKNLMPSKDYTDEPWITEGAE